MQKKYIIFLIVLVCSMLLCGCQYTYQLGKAEKAELREGMNYPDKTVQWQVKPSGWSFDKEMAAQRQIIFDGETFDCTYKTSFSDDWQTAFDFYQFTDQTVENRVINFSVEKGTDRIVSVLYGNSDLQLYEKEPDDVRTYVEEEAIKIASKYISTDEYTMTVSTQHTYVTDYGSSTYEQYTVRFVRYIGKNKTSDKLTLIFTKTGKFYGFYRQTPDRFKGYSESDFPVFSEEEYDKTVKAFLEEHLQSKDFDYKTRDRFFALSEENELLLIADLDVRVPREVDYRESYIGVKIAFEKV